MAETWEQRYNLIPGERCVCQKVIYRSLADAYEAAKRFKNQKPYVGKFCKQVHLTTIHNAEQETPNG